MVYQPACGARDILPLDVARQRWLEHRLERVFQSWSYQEIITPTIETLATLTAGGALKPETVIQVHSGSDELLGLRPELTASIARAAVTRMAGMQLPQRLYYKTNVFRRSAMGGSTAGDLGNQQEFFQAGVELLGATGLAADAEILWLVQECLSALGVDNAYLMVGDAQLTQLLLAEFPTELQNVVRQCLASLDRVSLQQLPSPWAERACQLFDLRGSLRDVEDELERWRVSAEIHQRFQALRQLLELVGDRLTVTLDLSLIQSFNYYTGIVFEVLVATETELRLVGQGGRYDQLLSVYHPDGTALPGIGFVFNVEQLLQAIAIPPASLLAARSQWLVAPLNPAALGAALQHAQTLRLDGSTRVELALLELAPEQIRAYARDRQIPYIAWIDVDTPPQIESLIDPLTLTQSRETATLLPPRS
ncbi:ATP phosphoribosyltransferase regulatory subunit [Parathermosynechococcus lividus]